MKRELPKGWSNIKFKEVAEATDFVANGSFASLKENVIQTEEEDYAILVRLKDYSNNWEGPFRYVTKESYNFLSKSSLKEGDLFIANVGYPGKLFLVPDLGKPMTIAPNGLRIRASEITTNKFLAYYYQSGFGKSQIDGMVTGTAQQKFNKTGLRNSTVIIPPVSEQERILAKLDKLFGHLDSLNIRLDRIPELLKNFRQQVLTQAVTGKLTENWRKQEDNKEKNYDPYEIPSTWFFKKLKGLSKKIKYGTSKKSLKEGKVPVLRMGNLQNGEIDWTDLKYSSDDAEIEKYELKEGDLLFNRTNSPELVGKTSIYRGNQKAIYAGYLIKVETKNNLDSEYLNFVLNSFYAKKWCWDVKTDGVSQSNINATKLGNFLIPTPPLEEQQEIVKRVNTLFDLILKAESLSESLYTKMDKLPQAILNKAFRGELIPQDPNDEPTSVLLERIRNKGVVKKRTPKKSSSSKSSKKQTRSKATKKTTSTGTINVRPNVSGKVTTKVLDAPPKSVEMKLFLLSQEYSVFKAIQSNLTKKSFDFDELMNLVKINYDQIWDELYDLLRFTQLGMRPGVIQKFDSKRNKMLFEWKGLNES